VTARDKDNAIVQRFRLNHQDRNGMRKSLATLPPGTPVVLESSFGWGWMADELIQAGLAPRLANARKVAWWRSVRGLAKSNRMDSDLLSELPSQNPPWWEVWLAPPVVRQQREWMRHRMALVQQQTALKNRIHAVLHRYGVLHNFADLFGIQGRRFLQLLIVERSIKSSEADLEILPASARTTIKNTLQLLDHVRRHIAQVTRELRHQVSRSAAGERLRTIPGIGWVLAYTILAEVGDIRRFGSAKQLCSYSLLAPIAWDSGEEDPEATPLGRHVGFIGRRTLKWAFIEAAHSAVRSGGRFREIYDRRTNGGKKDRNRGLIAVAHELCRVAYVTWTKEVDYMETPPPRPGSRSRRSFSRSVKGQPDVAMVVAE
jgi:transposase